MTSDAAAWMFTQAQEMILPISPTAQNQAWQNSQLFSTPASRYQAYLNQLCLSAVMPWLQEDYAPQAKVWPNQAALSSVWDVVNGTALASGTTRFILVPSDTIDTSELQVSQEWVDLPSWAGDYYLGVQVEPDEGWVRIWGYCTHSQLKHQARYHASDFLPNSVTARTYCLDEDELIKDLNVLGVVRQLCPNEPTRASITPLTALSSTQADNLIEHLAHPTIPAPRLAVSFELWGALLEHGAWRQQLYERRLRLAKP